MIHPTHAARQFLTLVKEEYGDPSDERESSQSQSQVDATLEIAEKLIEFFKLLISNPQSMEKCETLDVETIQDEYEETEDDPSIGDDDSADYDEEGKEEYEVTGFSLEYMRKVLQFSNTPRKFKTIQHHFRRVLHPCYISRFRKYIEEGGQRFEKLKKVSKSVVDNFFTARNQGLQVHDADLRRWAIVSARILELKNFKCSDTWIFNFKKQNRICSRKIVRIVARKDFANIQSIEDSAKTFLIKSIDCIKKFPPSDVYNTDQSGFNYEMSTNRTLSLLGEKTTFGSMKSMNASTHSYTIQPTISMSGKLVGKLLICLQETSGKFGPTVQKNLFSPPNTTIVASTSGKLSKNLVEQYCRESLLPYAAENFVLFYDSWNGQTDDAIYEEVLPLSKCTRMQIPPKTTSLIQPLDVYFFQDWKYFVKKIFKRVALDEMQYDLHQRNNVIKLQSLVHNQLSAPVFSDMILYAWYKSGYTDIRPPRFTNVKQVCFSSVAEECAAPECNEIHFLKCSWCEKYLCVKHFFEDFHYHDADLKSG